MRNKALLAIGFAIGYVLGARAGRERYEQIADTAGRLWRSPQARDVREAAAAKASEAAPFGHSAEEPGRHTDVFDTVGGTR